MVYIWISHDEHNSISVLGDLLDVNTSGIASGQILKWNGSAFIAGDDNVIQELYIESFVTADITLKYMNFSIKFCAVAYGGDASYQDAHDFDIQIEGFRFTTIQ